MPTKGRGQSKGALLIKDNNSKIGSGKFVKALRNILTYMPPSGSIKWEKDHAFDDEDPSKIIKVSVPPTAFIKNVNPNNGNATLVKKEFWNDENQLYIATLKVSTDLDIYTTLDKTLPRDAKWIDSRR